MPQNPTINKFSSFIGITLLILVIGFTILINFFVEKPIAKTEEIENVKEAIEMQDEILEDTIENLYNEPFTENDLANLWKLENIHTDSLIINVRENQTYMKIYRELGFTKLNPFRDSTLIEILGDSEMRKLFKDVSSSRYTIYNGIISFKHIEWEATSSTVYKSFAEPFKDFAIESMEAKDFEPAMREIATLIVKYQIRSISTLSNKGNFTQIEFKDGRKLFLIKENAEIVEDSYKKTINNARYLNDSTKIFLPSNF